MALKTANDGLRYFGLELATSQPFQATKILTSQSVFVVRKYFQKFSLTDSGPPLLLHTGGWAWLTPPTSWSAHPTIHWTLSICSTIFEGGHRAHLNFLPCFLPLASLPLAHTGRASATHRTACFVVLEATARPWHRTGRHGLVKFLS